MVQFGSRKFGRKIFLQRFHGLEKRIWSRIIAKPGHESRRIRIENILQDNFPQQEELHREVQRYVTCLPYNRKWALSCSSNKCDHFPLLITSLYYVPVDTAPFQHSITRYRYRCLLHKIFIEGIGSRDLYYPVLLT